MKLPLQLKNKALIKSLIVLLSCIVLLSLSSAFTSLNLSVEKIFTKVSGESKPDSNIVVIHISASDLENIGPWPIKRSYYALLINKLTSYKVKSIGLEIFLSAKFMSQTVYDNLLTKEIVKSGRVTLSSVAGNIIQVKDSFISDSLSYPSPRLLDDSIHTGHINYLQGPTFKIPMKIKSNGINEYAFSCRILESKDKFNLPNTVDVNFVSSWKSFKKYSLLDFYDLIQNQNDELNQLQDKTIIIGVSDLQAAPSLETNFDDEAPAFTLHAFALDNLIHKRYFRNDFKLISTILFSFLFILLVWFQKRFGLNKYLLFIVSFATLISTAFVVHTYLFLRLDYLAIILPSIFLFVYEAFSELTEQKSELEGVLDEARILRSLLSTKENELSTLKTNLDISGKTNSSDFTKKIKLLEEEISKLKENAEDEEEAEAPSSLEIKNFYGIIYRSRIIQNVVDLIQNIAPEDVTVLVTGESGTGKELVAKAIHSLSKRNKNNFVAVNCGALSESLLESELFGHVKGSFTSASADKIGRFETADNGTIFLDEIGETSENFQVKLLRVIQSGEFEKVGSSKTSKVNIRVIAATNKKLEIAVKEKKFREDLFYRLNVIRIDLPPLRERKDDIGPIALYFLNSEAPNSKFSKAVLDVLNNYKWSGNIRELESVIKRAAIFAKSSGRKMIQLNDLPNEIVKEFKLNFEDLVLDSLRQKWFSHSSITETAKELGDVSRTLVSENFRGLVFKMLTEHNFDEQNTAKLISNSDDEEINDRVKSKMQTFLKNIQDSIKEFPQNGFAFAKENLSSKYKNLPQKFHPYLDEVIKHLLK